MIEILRLFQILVLHQLREFSTRRLDSEYVAADLAALQLLLGEVRFGKHVLMQSENKHESLRTSNFY